MSGRLDWAQRHPVGNGTIWGLASTTGFRLVRGYLTRTRNAAAARRFFRVSLVICSFNLLYLAFLIYIAGPAAGPADPGYNPFAFWVITPPAWLAIWTAARWIAYARREVRFRAAKLRARF